MTAISPLEWQALLSLLLALALGAVIGFERQLRQHPAGLHTNALVALGSAGFVLVGVYFENDTSPSRIAAQIAPGIGFLCAGLIMRHGMTIRGLNTAATVWCSAAVGVLAGTGLTRLALMVGVLVLGANVLLHWIEHRFLGKGSSDERLR